MSATNNKPEDRKGWQAVLALPKGSYDVVVVWKVDRLARRVLDFLRADETLRERGAAVAAVADPVDMTTAQGRGFATMLAVFAEMEAGAISARVAGTRRHIIGTGGFRGERHRSGTTTPKTRTARARCLPRTLRPLGL